MGKNLAYFGQEVVKEVRAEYIRNLSSVAKPKMFGLGWKVGENDKVDSIKMICIF